MEKKKTKNKQTYGHQIETLYQNRISDKEHSLNNTLKIFLNEPIGAFGLIIFKLNLGSKIIFKIQDDVEGPVYLI